MGTIFRMNKTIEEAMVRAWVATDAAEVDRCFDEAMRLTASCYDARALLAEMTKHHLVARERVAAGAARTLELAAAQRDVWGFRHVAEVYATVLSDPAEARSALEMCATVFRAGGPAKPGGQASARGYEWVLLGEGFLKTLQDEPGLRGCLEAGLESARARHNAEDLCAIACEWAKRLEPEAAVALLHEAEALATNGSAQPWTLANGWFSVGRADDVKRVLDAALQRATTCDAALHVLRAWASHGHLAEARRAMGRAHQLAATADEWLSSAEATFDAGLGAKNVRTAIEGAERLATDDSLRARVSSAYLSLLRDMTAALRLGPRGVEPAALRRPAQALAHWRGSAAGLFDWLRARVTSELLAQIAQADYGSDADKHLTALRDICESGLVPRHLGWQPHEVLALTRWSCGAHVNHVARALSCTLLCLAPHDVDKLVTDGPILVESCLALGPEARQHVEQFLVWRCETVPFSQLTSDEEQPVALLLLLIARAGSTPDDARLDSLARMLLEHSERPPNSVAKEIANCMRANLWDDLITRSLVPLRSQHAGIGQLLAALGR